MIHNLHILNCDQCQWNCSDFESMLIGVPVGAFGYQFCFLGTNSWFWYPKFRVRANFFGYHLIFRVRVTSCPSRNKMKKFQDKTCIEQTTITHNKTDPRRLKRLNCFRPLKTYLLWKLVPRIKMDQDKFHNLGWET